ncbi:phosphonate C-P lyase system protein PhnG [Pseudothauera nasutitermitis]|uniref:Phosphonate C-P lyase system protein PhnG n=2 Tax=Pseudothauera nasutitermitis TaxID=2565930 RepID=A0A4V3WBQ3_9RHOO|nr:phosphonate C-P lyase system protein PhnG [Pseudothauera nasutitermitis]
MQNPHDDPAIARRRRWMGVLAQAPRETLERAWRRFAAPPAFEWLRRPETGLVMTRGRAGGSGRRFNLGELCVTRAAVRLEGGAVGHAYVAGRDGRRAELAALFDALLQQPTLHDELERELIGPLAEAAHAAREDAARKAAATRVEFFTLVRGEDA